MRREYPPTRKETADIDVRQFKSLANIDPVHQLEWVQDNIDADAVGVDGLTMNAQQDEPPECSVTYHVVRPVP